MPRSAPRIDTRLVAALERLDRPGRPIADTNRRVGLLADHLGLTRPSYEQVRVVIHALRRGRRGSGAGSLLLEISLQQRPPEAIIDLFLP